ALLAFCAWRIPRARNANTVSNSVASASQAPYGLALSLTTLGRNYREKGEYKQAKEALDQAVEIRRQLLATQPLDRENRFQLAIIYNQLGLVQIRGLKNIQDGVDALNNAKALCERLSQEVPGQAEYVSELAQTLHNFVYQADFSGKYEQA